MYKIIGLLAVMIGTAGLANAGFFSDVKTAIVGHVEDALIVVYLVNMNLLVVQLLNQVSSMKTADRTRLLLIGATGSVSHCQLKMVNGMCNLNEDFNSGPLA